jgi:hypothetical protein
LFGDGAEDAEQAQIGFGELPLEDGRHEGFVSPRAMIAEGRL